MKRDDDDDDDNMFSMLILTFRSFVCFRTW